MRIALYTVNLNNYDAVKPLNKAFVRGVDCFLFTNSATVPSGWTRREVTPVIDPVRQQREIKINFHKYLPGYDLVIYIDANFQLYRPIFQLIRNIQSDFTTVKHPSRNCVYKEAEEIQNQGKADYGTITNQIKDYKERNILPEAGMWATGLLIRKPTNECIDFCETWSTELRIGSHRDQLAIAAARQITGKEIATISWQEVSRYFKRSSHIHNVTSKVTPQIWYSCPYRSDKNIGKANNEFCELVPGDDDWIVIHDADALFATPTFGKQIEDVVRKYGSTYSLLGCYTNRIGGKHQIVPNMFNIWDLREHVKKAKELEEKHYAEVLEIKEGVAGFFMMFQKKTWKKFKFKENTHTADTYFYKDIRRSKGKVGLIKGLYMIHLYRPLSDDPRFDLNHLV